MRCPDCAKFVSFDEPEVELTDEEVRLEMAAETEEKVAEGDTNKEMEFHFSAEARVVLKCADCGTELKETTFNLEKTHEHTCESAPPRAETQVEMLQPEETEFDASGFDRMQDKDRRGNLIRNHRYMKHLYGADVTATARCPYCQILIEANMQDECASSEFEELV